jgi:hypothetical protein
MVRTKDSLLSLAVSVAAQRNRESAENKYTPYLKNIKNENISHF